MEILMGVSNSEVSKGSSPALLQDRGRPAVEVRSAKVSFGGGSKIGCAVAGTPHTTTHQGRHPYHYRNLNGDPPLTLALT